MWTAVDHCRRPTLEHLRRSPWQPIDSARRGSAACLRRQGFLRKRAESWFESRTRSEDAVNRGGGKWVQPSKAERSSAQKRQQQRRLGSSPAMRCCCHSVLNEGTANDRPISPPIAHLAGPDRAGDAEEPHATVWAPGLSLAPTRPRAPSSCCRTPVTP